MSADETAIEKHAAKIVLDSISETGQRLTTFELTFPRYVLAEFNTHKVIAKNSASSRAIPIAKRIAAVDDPYIPPFGSNQPGMQAGDEIANPAEAEEVWLLARDEAVLQAQQLMELGVHKQVANRLLEPFGWHTVIATATAWENFFLQRSSHHSDNADPAISPMATLAEDAYRVSTPKPLKAGEWHLPYYGQTAGGSFEDFYDGVELAKELDIDYVELTKIISAARCARVSYLTHDGQRDMMKDFELYTDVLRQHGHWSPLEHVATPCDCDEYTIESVDYDMIDCRPDHQGCLQGWDQFRHEVERALDIITYR